MNREEWKQALSQMGPEGLRDIDRICYGHGIPLRVDLIYYWDELTAWEKQRVMVHAGNREVKSEEVKTLAQLGRDMPIGVWFFLVWNQNAIFLRKEGTQNYTLRIADSCYPHRRFSDIAQQFGIGSRWAPCQDEREKPEVKPPAEKEEPKPGEDLRYYWVRRKSTDERAVFNKLLGDIEIDL